MTAKEVTMPEILTERAPETPIDDREILRRAGIAPDLAPRLSTLRRALLALALLLAGSTALFAGLFQANSPTSGDDYETASTQCPMGD